MGDRLAGKVAVVTGGCSGIGLATVRRFAQEGAKVVIADLNDELGEQYAAEVGGTYVHTNVADKADGAPAKVRVRERPTYWDDRLRARRSRHKFKHRSRR